MKNVHIKKVIVFFVLSRDTKFGFMYVSNA